MLVAQIAYDKMTADGATGARDRVSFLAGKLKGKQAPYNFLTASFWLDVVRSRTSDPWHVVAMPWTPDGVSFVEPPGPDALRTITAKLAMLRAGSLAVTGEARDVAVVTHLVGDLHQPLHCASKDDYLGTRVALTGVARMHTLHALWDAAYRYDEEEGRTFFYSEQGLPRAPGAGPIADWARYLVGQYALDADPTDLVPLHWARESHKLGCADGYTGLRDLPPRRGWKRLVAPEPGYVHRAHEDACERLVLAGYRLANLLESVYGPRTELTMEADQCRPLVR
jgi:hypothetical protein